MTQRANPIDHSSADMQQSTMKLDPITARAAEALQPIIDFCAQNPGTQALIRAELDRQTGLRWDRINIMRWLHPDPEKRVEPGLGAGLLLVEAGHEVVARERRKQKRRAEK